MQKLNPIPFSISLLPIQILAFWPVWKWYLERMLDGSDEPWGVLALITALAIAVVKGRASGFKKLPFFVSIIFLLLYIIGYHFLTPLPRATLAMFSFGVLISGCFFGKTFHLSFIALLLLSLPIIATLQFFGGYPVRLLTAWLSSQLIGLSGYKVTPEGTSLFWLGELISVDAPCAGIRMLWTGLYLNFTLACINGLGIFSTWICYAFAMLAIFSSNVLRATALFYGEAEIISYPSWAHQGIGILCFSIAVILIISIQQVVKKRVICCKNLSL